MGYDIPSDHHGPLPSDCHTAPGSTTTSKAFAKDLNTYAEEVHKANAKWWVDLNTGQPVQRNVGELLMLSVSELAEAMEGHRKSKMDDHLPHRQMFDVEIVDCMIRLFDIAAGMHIDIETIYQEKMAYNAVRADHKIENRRLADGKKY